MLISTCLSCLSRLVVLSSIFFPQSSSKRLFHDTSGDTFRIIIAYQKSIMLVLKIYGKANFLKMLIDVDHDNFRTVLLQTPNTFHSYPELEVQNPSFPPFHVIFEKSFNYDTKFVYFLAKTFSCCYLCCFWLKNVVSTSN